jgi:hypothetical protein
MPKDKGPSRIQRSFLDHFSSQWSVAENPYEKMKIIKEPQNPILQLKKQTS